MQIKTVEWDLYFHSRAGVSQKKEPLTDGYFHRWKAATFEWIQKLESDTLVVATFNKRYLSEEQSKNFSEALFKEPVSIKRK